MNVEAFEFNTSINPNNFPAKLWRVVNSPCYQSIRWDSSGETIVIDQQLFQSELLCHSQHLYGNDIFKTSNFASFIRQLNLYGFKKIIMGSGNSHKLLNAESNVGFRDGQIHYFRNIYFRRDRPNLLVKIKRLTSTNKAKMAAGLDVSSRPPNRYQRMLTNSQVEQNSGHKQDPVNTGQINCRLRHETVSTYPYMPSTSHSLGFPLRGLDRTPMPSRMWPDSLGLLPRQVESASSFLEQSMCYPVLQRFPTDVSYALQPSATALHVQQNLSNMTGAVQEYNMYVPSAMSYPRTYYPTAPQVFIRVLGALIIVMHERGIRITPYMDELLLKALSGELLQQQVQDCIHTLTVTVGF
ncbi:heat shock factor protein 5 [Rhinophrynus dorsalis]